MFVLSKGSPKSINRIEDKKNAWGGTETFGRITERQSDGELSDSKGKKVVKEYGVRNNVWRYNTGSGRSSSNPIAHKHPAIFPEALAKDHIISWSDKSDIVFDPFMGSGTTAVAALDTERHFVGAEIAKEYVEIANERIKTHTTQTDIFDVLEGN